MSSSILVADFDGTITRHDFFTCVVETLLTPGDLAPWHLYTAGEITHFEALRRIFARIRADEAHSTRSWRPWTSTPICGTRSLDWDEQDGR